MYASSNTKNRNHLERQQLTTMFEVCRQKGAFSHTPEDFKDIYADKTECCQAEIRKSKKIGQPPTT